MATRAQKSASQTGLTVENTGGIIDTVVDSVMGEQPSESLVSKVIADEAVRQLDVVQALQKAKPVLEYVQVKSFLPLDIEVGKRAYVKVLGEFDTLELQSTIPVFTEEVINILEDGFETTNAYYKEVK